MPGQSSSHNVQFCAECMLSPLNRFNNFSLFLTVLNHFQQFLNVFKHFNCFKRLLTVFTVFHYFQLFFKHFLPFIDISSISIGFQSFFNVLMSLHRFYYPQTSRGSVFPGFSPNRFLSRFCLVVALYVCVGGLCVGFCQLPMQIFQGL